MQKNNNASILLWSIFLSLIIMTLFTSISTKIWKSIRENKKIENYIEIDKTKEDFIKQTSNLKTNEDTIKLTDNENLIIDNKKYFSKTLKRNESININVDNVNTNLTLKTNNWSFVKYSTWTLTNLSNPIFLDWDVTIKTSSWEIINIANSGWLAKIEILSEKNISFPNKNYKVIETIWNKTIEKESWVIIKN